MMEAPRPLPDGDREWEHFRRVLLKAGSILVLVGATLGLIHAC